MSKEQIASLEWTLLQILKSRPNSKIKSIVIEWKRETASEQSHYITYNVVPNIKVEYYE
jgi:hypothetical protein